MCLGRKIPQDTSPCPTRPTQLDEAFSFYPSPIEGTKEWPGGGARAHIGEVPASHRGTLQILGNCSPSSGAQGRTKDPSDAASCLPGRPPSSLPLSLPTYMYLAPSNHHRAPFLGIERLSLPNQSSLVKLSLSYRVIYEFC